MPTYPGKKNVLIAAATGEIAVDGNVTGVVTVSDGVVSAVAVLKAATATGAAVSAPAKAATGVAVLVTVTVIGVDVSNAMAIGAHAVRSRPQGR